jgi:hypothetical protein
MLRTHGVTPNNLGAPGQAFPGYAIGPITVNVTPSSGERACGRASKGVPLPESQSVIVGLIYAPLGRSLSYFATCMLRRECQRVAL